MWPTDKVESTRRSNILSFKPFHNSVNQGSSAVERTWYAKYLIPAEFTAVRVILLNQQKTTGASPLGEISGTTICVASSETMDTSIANISPNGLAWSARTPAVTLQQLLFSPLSNTEGTTIATNNVKDATSNLGWRTTKWADGAASVLPTVLGVANTTVATYIPNAGVANNSVSDWIPLKAHRCKDAGKSGFPFMMRIHHNEATGGLMVRAAMTTETQPYAIPASLNADIQFSANSGDGITDVLLNVPTGLGASGSAQPYYLLQFRCKDEVITGFIGGDSISSANTPMVLDGISSFGFRGIAAASQTTGIPAMSVACGCPSQTMDTYWSAAQALMEIMASGNTTSQYGAYPNVAIFAPWSPNGVNGASPMNITGPTSQWAIQKMGAILGEFLSYCDKNRIWPVLWTGLPYSGGSPATGVTAAEDAERQLYNAAIKAIPSNKCTIIDANDLVVNTSTPTLEAWTPLYGSLGGDGVTASGDGIHPNPTGIGILATAGFTPALTQLFQRLK